MLSKFSVSNFKNFKNKVTFKLNNPCNYEFNNEIVVNNIVSKGIVYGINGSGKSNFALALFDIIFHLTDKEKIYNKYNLYLNLNSKKPFAEFEYDFIFDGVKVNYKYGKINVNSLVYESLSIDDKEVLFYDFRSNEGAIYLEGAELLNIVGPNPISRVKYIKGNAILKENKINNAFYKFVEFVDNMLMFYSLDTRGYQGLLVGPDIFTQGIVRENKTKEFEEFLKKQSIDCELVEKEINGTKDLFWHFEKGDYPFSSVASTGTMSLALFYYWYIVMSKASFVFIDEFDAFYHFELAESIVESIKGLKNTQVFVSTHNTDLLSNDILRPDSYFILNNGSIKSLNNLVDKDLRKAHNIQKMYKAGSFDG